MNKFQKDLIEKVEKRVNKILNFANSERSWTKEQIANIIIFLNDHYRIQYGIDNSIKLYNITTGNFIVKFDTYMDFIDWYNNLVFSN